MHHHYHHQMSSFLRKPAFCIHVFESKGADELCGNSAADQPLSFHYIEQELNFPNPKFQASSHLLWLYIQVH